MARESGPVKKACFCPYCDAEIEAAASFRCRVCEVVIFYCPSCRQPVARDKKTCPNCGAEIKGEAPKGG